MLKYLPKIVIRYYDCLLAFVAGTVLLFGKTARLEYNVYIVMKVYLQSKQHKEREPVENTHTHTNNK